MALRQTVLAACLQLTAAGAAAQAGSSASLDNFRYELIDLAPQDKLAPSISLSPARILGESFIYLQSFTFPVSEASTQVFGTVGVDNAFGSAGASLAPDYDARAAADAQAYSARAGTLLDLSFVLSPNTRVIFSADGKASALPQNGFTYAEAVLTGEITTPFISHGTRFSASVYSFNGEEESQLSVVANAGLEPSEGVLSLRSSASAESFAPPVPEPGAAAMLLGGLLVLAGARRKRARGRGITASG